MRRLDFCSTVKALVGIIPPIDAWPVLTTYFKKCPKSSIQSLRGNDRSTRSRLSRDLPRYASSRAYVSVLTRDTSVETRELSNNRGQLVGQSVKSTHVVLIRMMS